MRPSTWSLRHLLPYLAVAWCIGWMAYGAIRYPHAPIKPCGNDTYCDKRHDVHFTAEEYTAFRRWELLLFLSWPFGMAGGYVIRKRRK